MLIVNIKLNQSFIKLVLMILLFLLTICIMHQSAKSASSETSIQLPVGTFSEIRSNDTLPRISFVKTVCDLGDVGPGHEEYLRVYVHKYRTALPVYLARLSKTRRIMSSLG